jgi:hypothetical protein
MIAVIGEVEEAGEAGLCGLLTGAVKRGSDGLRKEVIAALIHIDDR